MARRRKPTDPAALYRQAEAKRDREAEVKRLAAQGASFKLDTMGRVISAWRSNVFTLLLERKTITASHHDAAYRLAQEWATWKGLDGKPEGSMEFVDGGSGCAELVTDRMIRAGRDVNRTLAQLQVSDRSLIEAFMVATVEEDRPMAWRGIVERVRGKMPDRQQVAAVVDALEALRAVYQEPREMAA